MEDTYRTEDEIEILAEAFANLSKRTRDYIVQITRITAEKERIGAELELATKIQADMLPNIYPAFPDREEFDIYATMTPAKEVGGDFYDFFLIDDDHLGLVMADVSGKGVPAALFMMMSKILVNNYAMMGESPARVLEQVNNQICKNNDEEMFVTVWFGVLEISTGKVTAANAGHEYPMVKKADGSFELFKDKHGSSSAAWRVCPTRNMSSPSKRAVFCSSIPTVLPRRQMPGTSFSAPTGCLKPSMQIRRQTPKLCSTT